MPPVQVTRTYLELSSPGALRPAAVPAPAPRLERVHECPVSFFRYLYVEVGRAFHWTDRLVWDDARVQAHLADPANSLWLLTWRAAPAGYFELARREEPTIDLAYFGLMPHCVGRGLGRYLLYAAIAQAWSYDPKRLTVNTTTMDHPRALPLYQQMGFVPYQRQAHEMIDPELTGIIPA